MELRLRLHYTIIRKVREQTKRRSCLYDDYNAVKKTSTMKLKLFRSDSFKQIIKESFGATPGASKSPILNPAIIS